MPERIYLPTATTDYIVRRLQEGYVPAGLVSATGFSQNAQALRSPTQSSGTKEGEKLRQYYIEYVPYLNFLAAQEQIQQQKTVSTVASIQETTIPATQSPLFPAATNNVVAGLISSPQVNATNTPDFLKLALLAGALYFVGKKL